MKVYLASPFFNNEEIRNVAAAEEILRSKGLDVYSPREHEDRAEAGTREWSENIFAMDVTAINEADIVVMLYYGNYSDSGTAWECGYAFGLNKPCIVVHIDEDSNLMIHEGSHANIIGLDGLAQYDFNTLSKHVYEGKMF